MQRQPRITASDSVERHPAHAPSRYTMYGYSPTYQQNNHYYSNRQAYSLSSPQSIVINGRDNHEQVSNQILALQNASRSETAIVNLQLINLTDDILDRLYVSFNNWQRIANFRIDAAQITPRSFNTLHKIFSRIPSHRLMANPPFELDITRNGAYRNQEIALSQHLNDKRRSQQYKITLAKTGLVAGYLVLGAFIVGALIETFLGFLLTLLLTAFAIKYSIDFFSSLSKMNSINNQITQFENRINEAPAPIDLYTPQPQQTLQYEPVSAPTYTTTQSSQGMYPTIFPQQQAPLATAPPATAPCYNSEAPMAVRQP